MGTIQIDLFTTLDGVAQAPGGPEEDTEGGFAFGGWQFPVSDEVVGEHVVKGMEGLDALLLGRKTYDIFAAYWPYHDGIDNEIAALFNRIPKYVASRGTPDLGWAHSSQLGPDLRRRAARPAGPPREHPRHRQPRPGADPVRRAPLRPAVAVGLPARARRRQEGLHRQRHAVEPDPRRATRDRLHGRGAAALRARRGHAHHGRHGRPRRVARHPDAVGPGKVFVHPSRVST